MEFDVFDAVVQYGTGEKFDDILRDHPDYDRVNEEYKKIYEVFDKSDLPDEQKSVVKKLLDLFADKLALYVEVAYEQGIHDAVKLLKGMEVL